MILPFNEYDPRTWHDLPPSFEWRPTGITDAAGRKEHHLWRLDLEPENDVNITEQYHAWKLANATPDV